MEITGRSVVLTGASGGLGAAIAEELAARGARLTITARRAEQLEALSARTGAEVLVADLCDPSGLEQVCAAARAADALVANAGMGSDVALAEMTAAEVDRSIDVNLRGPILMATEFAQAHLDRGAPGQIVFVGSLSGMAASPNTRMYNATKFGLRGFSLSLREDLIGTGIGVSIVEPGFIRDAGMFAESGMSLPKGVRTKTPVEVAHAVAKAIRTNPAEAFVAPIELRLGATLATVAPALSAWVQRRAGAADITASRDR
ncbi:MAG: SDR family NAD(P)-dependent oxidoreductase [Microthrixaceae bacterium]